MILVNIISYIGLDFKTNCEICRCVTENIGALGRFTISVREKKKSRRTTAVPCSAADSAKAYSAAASVSEASVSEASVSADSDAVVSAEDVPMVASSG
ncbi:MAG: hypothetical protein IJ368_06850, partial [Oscillospiraceae bacterium]|nr:hypothetical protein [Oscillospiraceae bacterium]